MYFFRIFIIQDIKHTICLLSINLRWRIYSLFFLMFMVALFEVLSILSMSFMAMSVAAPQILLKNNIIQDILTSVPLLADICNDTRYFTLIAALSVVGLTFIKNVLTAVQTWKSACLGEDVANFAGHMIFRHFLNSPYMWHISGTARKHGWHWGHAINSACS